MGATGSFEDMIGRAKDELRRLADAAEDLVTAVVRASDGGVLPDMDVLRRQDQDLKRLSARQHAVFARLADAVRGISDILTQERIAFERREVPGPLDVVLGFLSKRMMRRRMRRRRMNSGGVERLRLVLGRSDRLAGMIASQRHLVTEQRAAAEDALDRLLSRRSAGPAGDLHGSDSASREEGARLDEAGRVYAVLVSILNRSATDLTTLMHKLAFDVEHALELCGVLIEADNGRTGRSCISPEAYPHFSDAVARFADGFLPGARLAGLREAADAAFFDRFDPVPRQGAS